MALYKAWDYVNENSSGAKVGTLTMNGQNFDVKDNQADTSVTFSSIRNTGNTTEGSGTLRRIGKVVCLNFSTTIKNALAVNTWLSVGMLPSGYRPSEGFSFIACTTATSTTFLRGFLWANDGNIGVQTPVAFSAGMQIRGSVTYFVA